MPAVCRGVPLMEARRFETILRERRRDYVSSLLEVSRNAAAVSADLERQLEEAKAKAGP